METYVTCSVNHLMATTPVKGNRLPERSLNILLVTLSCNTDAFFHTVSHIYKHRNMP